jgi:signal transduction histidine kinase
MKPMDETIHSTRGFPRITGTPRPAGAAKLRLAGLMLTALLGSLLIIWVSRTTWQRVDVLQREFAGLKADSFYLGVRMRNDIQRLNDTLLRYRLRGDVADSEVFRAEAQIFKDWLENSRSNTLSAVELEFIEEIRNEYNSYLTDSIEVLEASLAWLRSSQARDFKKSYEKVQQQSEHLLFLCDTFIENQRSTFDHFLKESNHTLTSFQRLLKLALALLLTLAAALVALVYRGMIAPLRHQLTESQAIIARQEKLASLGALAAGVAHEIRNPLTAIKFRLFSLKKTLPAGGTDNEDAAVIGEEISRLERIVKDFLHFARPSEPAFVTIPVERILQEVYELLKPQLEKVGIELKLEPSGPAWVRVDTQQIKQVLINLVQNSADSIGRDGEITLRQQEDAVAGRRASGTVVLEVADNGEGIPPEVQERLFDPFFTTKEGGTGLGLSIAARIVEKHGGELRYQTEHNGGTIFFIVLPRVPEYETKNPVDRR